jgi:hypothetical protein
MRTRCLFLQILTLFLIFFLDIRGLSADLYNIDEAAFKDPDELYSAILPMATNAKAVTFMLSSAASTENYFEQLPRKTINGKKIFYTIAARMVCESCADNGQMDDSCPHNIHELPPWRSEESLELQKALMPQDIFRREAQGFATDEEKYAFTRKLVDKLRSPSSVVSESDAGRSTVLFTFIDPTGGAGQRSKMAILSLLYDRGNFTIISIENQTTQLIQNQEVVTRKHFSLIKQHPVYNKCLKVVFVENNLSKVQASSIKEHIGDYHPIHFVTSRIKNGSSNFGVQTTNETKSTGLKIAQDLLQKGKLRRLKTLIGTNTDVDFAELAEQASLFRIEETNNGLEKLTGKSSVTQDDLIVSLICCLCHASIKIHTPAFHQYVESLGFSIAM